MHRNDKSKFLLYIEPKKEEKLRDPIHDDLTKLMELALFKSKRGSANYSNINKPESFQDDGWMGWHTTDCGYEDMDSNDYLLENGMITNSMCVFYVKRYRYSIHENDWNKLVELGEFYGVNISLPTTFLDSPESTNPKTYDDHMKDMTNMLVDELTKSIEKNILEKLKNN